jgi:dihydroflavonol-4-reductase
VPGDLSDIDALRTLVDGAELVFHLAAHITIEDRDEATVERTNVGGPQQVVNACLHCEVPRLVHFSSIHAFSPDPDDDTVVEARPNEPNARHLYDRTKARGEDIVREGIDKGLDAVIVNPTAIIGPYDFKPSKLGKVFLDLYHGRMPAVTTGGFNWVDVRDIVAGALAAAENGKTGEQYLLSGHHRSIAGLANEFCAVAGKKAPRIVLPIPLARLAVPFAAIQARITGEEPRFTQASLDALVNHQKVSHDKATAELGYEPRPLEETFQAIVDWFAEAGMLEDRR